MALHKAFAAVVLALLASPAPALDGKQLGLVVNTSDPLSVEIGEYYAARRGIVFQNVIKVAFPPGRSSLSRQEFEAVNEDLKKQLRPHVQALALTWAAPYRVECMSITSAFAFGFDPAYCAAGCQGTKPSAYFDSPSRRPYRDLKIRPTMALAAASLENAKQLIDRGIASDASRPQGTAYLLSTSDRMRNVRAALYRSAEKALKGKIGVRVLHQDWLNDARDVLFYFTGRSTVEGLGSLGFVPGAMADHLTSSGGMLTDSPQMSALRWLEAGATGSYGTVVEPCNLPQKFPHPAVAIGRYLAGETLIEAYWKSVRMPGQGIFIGEPLAAPYRRSSSPLTTK